jgi:RimJ/RimL family protein N-acetyltransferase
MRRAFEKAGWKFEGILKALFVEDGVPHDYYSFAITRFA